MAGGWDKCWLTTMRPFYESYPHVGNGVVEVVEEGDGTKKTGNQVWGFRVLGFDDFNGIVPCSNPRCNGGGASILMEVDEMIKNRETERSKHEVCHGKTKHDICCNSFKLRIRLTYKD